MNALQLKHYNICRDICARHGGKLLSDRYVNAHWPLNVECANGHGWEITPNNLKNGKWCADCYFELRRVGLDKVREYITSRGGELVSGEYVRSDISKLTIRCDEGHEWTTVWSSLNGHWCPECGGKKRKTIEELQDVALKRGGKLISDEYVSSGEQLEWECSKGHRWITTWAIIQTGCWCPVCRYENMAVSMKLSISTVREKVKEKGGKLLTEVYTDCRTKMEIECSKGHRWMTTWGIIRDDHWCPICRNENMAASMKLSISTFREKVEEKGGKLLSETYVDCRTKMEIECSKGHRWKTTWMIIRDDHWCPICRKSRGERIISDSLSKWNVKYQEQYVIESLPKRRFDVYFEYQTQRHIVEFDGSQHFESVEFFDRTSSIEDRHESDILKTYTALSLGYKVIRIDYTMINEIETHLIKGVYGTSMLYLSTPELYDWLMDGVSKLGWPPKPKMIINQSITKPKPKLKVVNEL